MLGKLLTKKQRKLAVRYSLIGLVAIFVLIGLLTEWKFSKLVLGGLGEQFSTKVYASPTFIKSRGTQEQVPLSGDSLKERLRRLGYREVTGDTTNPGEYSQDGHRFKIYLNGFESPYFNQVSEQVTLNESNRAWLIMDGQGQELEEIALEPEMAAELSGSEKIRREPATWEEIPVRLSDAVVAIEDAGFYHHWGISPRAVARAAWSNFSGKKLQGGSTITQQLAKNLFLSPQRTLRRKIAEALFALYLEIRFSKEKILALYLNHIYMGQDGVVSVAGVKSASLFYFGKPLSDLSVSECAFLAGVIRSPFKYNPFREPEEALKRRNLVLGKMKEHTLISDREYKDALLEKLHFRQLSNTKSGKEDNDYFVSEVVRQLLPKYGEEEIFRCGLKIYTTMDPLLQKYAQAAVQKTNFQAAFVALNPTHGSVWALVGGKSYKVSQFNRATQANRQPGSAFKPFVYGAAIENGVTAATILIDKPKPFSDGKGGKWLPKNYDGKYMGQVSVRLALANSLNSATLDLLQQVGANKAVEFAQRMGITSPLEKSLAIALGASEVNLLELTGAYSPFANGGYFVQPELIHAVVDAEENVLEIRSEQKKSVLDPSVSFVMTTLMQSVIKEGTAKSLPKLGWPYESAGKTGTTNDGKDAWFIGYTPELVAGAWVGDDKAKSISVTGAKNALPIWAAFMINTYKGTEPGLYEEPPNIVNEKIDPLSGLVARSGCPTPRNEYFIKGTEPIQTCPLHDGGVKGWFNKIFKKKEKEPTSQ